jgi:hypothetical protein
MKSTNSINLHNLKTQAERSQDHEAFTVLSKTTDYRIGAGTRFVTTNQTTYFIEIIINMNPHDKTINLKSTQKKLTLLQKLKQKHYQLTSEEDGSISCELIASEENLTKKAEAAISLLNRFFKVRQQSARCG